MFSPQLCNLFKKKNEANAFKESNIKESCQSPNLKISNDKGKTNPQHSVALNFSTLFPPFFF